MSSQPSSSPTARPELPLQAVTLIFVLGTSLVTLTPTTHFITELGQQKGMAWLTAIASSSAVAEIGLSPLIGGLSDSIGRKSVLLMTLASTCAVNVIAAIFPRLIPVGASKFVSSCVIGIFFLAASASLADLFRHDPKRLAAASGLLFALVNAGFGLGIAASGLLPAGLRVRYAASAVVIGAALGAALLSVRETLPMASRLPFRAASFHPFAFVRLLRLGRTMRLLACLAALNLAPIFMGDVLQAFAISAWQLDEVRVSQLFTFIAVGGVLANGVGGTLIRWMGLARFTALSTASSLLLWAGFASGSLPVALICSALGVLGAARTLGATTMMTSEGARLGVPQGQLSGDRANLIAWLKVLGPLIYGQLYILGAAIRVPTAPFLLNAALMVASLLLGQLAIAQAEAGAAERQRK